MKIEVIEDKKESNRQVALSNLESEKVTLNEQLKNALTKVKRIRLSLELNKKETELIKNA